MKYQVPDNIKSYCNFKQFIVAVKYRQLRGGLFWLLVPRNKDREGVGGDVDILIQQFALY